MPPSTRTANYVPETNIVKTKDPTAIEDEWPIFVLSNAIVYRPDGVTMANAILVAEEGPCIVRGRLEVDDEEDFQYLVKPSVRAANIEAKNIENYSIGDDPQGVVWLASSAGWFEINPHPSYERIYRSMCDMTVLYYILLGIYVKACEGGDSKSKYRILGTLDIKEILFEYAVALGNGTTYDEAVETCVELGPMLLAHFARSKDLDWAKSSFYKWLVKELKDRERSARSSSRGESAAPGSSHSQTGAAQVGAATTPVPLPQAYSVSSQAYTPSSLSQQLPFRAPPGVAASSASPGPSRESPVPLPSHVSRGSSGSAPPVGPVQSQSFVPGELRERVFKSYLEIIEAIGKAHGDPGKISAGKVHTGFFTKFRVRAYNTGKHLSSLFSRELLDSLSDEWHGSPYEAWLTSKEAQDFIPPAPDLFLRDIPDQLVRRAQQAPTNTDAASAAAAAATSAATVAAASAAVTTARGTATPRTNSPVPSPRTSGKRAVLRPPNLPRKRAYESIDNSDIADNASVASRGSTPRPIGRPRKTAKSNHEGSGAGSHPSQAMHIDSSSSSDSDADDSEDERRKQETMLAVHSKPLLVSTKPTGPNRTWTCPQPGCDYFVRNAGTPDLTDDDSSDEDDEASAGDSDKARFAAARQNIKAHLRGHEEEMLSRVDLAISEGTRGHVSVDHLLEKIRTLADKNSQRAPAAATTAAAAVASTVNGRPRYLF